MYYYKYLIELWFIFFIGGIVDIIVYYKVDDGFLEEMWEVSGGLWGGKFVDDVFEMFIEDIIGKELMKKLRIILFDDYLELMRNFEMKKRLVKFGKEGNIFFFVFLGFV